VTGSAVLHSIQFEGIVAKVRRKNLSVLKKKQNQVTN